MTRTNSDFFLEQIRRNKDAKFVFIDIESSPKFFTTQTGRMRSDVDHVLEVTKCQVCEDKPAELVILKGRRPGMRTLVNAIDATKPVCKVHKKRRNQTMAYHKRIQKKWRKKWEAEMKTWQGEMNPFTLSLPTGAITKVLQEFSVKLKRPRDVCFDMSTLRQLT